MTGIPVVNCPQNPTERPDQEWPKYVAAQPEKSMQLQGWGPKCPLWNLGRIQSISLLLSLCLPLCLSYQCVCRNSLETAESLLFKLRQACTSEVSLASIRFGLKLYTHCTFVLSELILIYSCLHQWMSKGNVLISDQNIAPFSNSQCSCIILKMEKYSHVFFIFPLGNV